VKKARERQALERFRQSYPGFPTGAIVDSESPDFLVLGNGRTIGIEVVGYVSGQGKGGSRERLQEKLRKRVVDTARVIFERDHPIPLWVNVFFRPGLQLHGRSVDALATALAEAVAGGYPKQGAGRVDLGFDDLEESLWERGVLTVHIHRLDGLERNVWGSVEAGFIGWEIEELAQALAPKESKVATYRTRCDEVWALIVAEGLYPSSIFSTDRLQNQSPLASGFDRVVFFDLQELRAVTLVPMGAAALTQGRSQSAADPRGSDPSLPA
jgi:hypothetical protein